MIIELKSQKELAKENINLQSKLNEIRIYTNHLIKDMGIDNYYLDKIYLEKHITKYLDIIESEGEKNE